MQGHDAIDMNLKRQISTQRKSSVNRTQMRLLARRRLKQTNALNKIPIEQMTLKEDRVRPSVLVRLSNIHVVCGNIKTANMYREKYKESIVCVNLLHPPSARLSIDVKFFNELWGKIDQGQAPEISGDLLHALQLGVVENKEDDEDHDDDGKKTGISPVRPIRNRQRMGRVC